MLQGEGDGQVTVFLTLKGTDKVGAELEVAQFPVDESRIPEIPLFIMICFPNKYPGLPDLGVDGVVDDITPVTTIYVLRGDEGIFEGVRVDCKLYEPLLYPKIVLRLNPEYILLQEVPTNVELGIVKLVEFEEQSPFWQIVYVPA